MADTNYPDLFVLEGSAAKDAPTVDVDPGTRFIETDDNGNVTRYMWSGSQWFAFDRDTEAEDFLITLVHQNALILKELREINNGGSV